MKFKHLSLEGWKQFESLDIEFHPRLTVLTGANGAGKTTILNLLSQHFGWGFQELATPAKDKLTGILRYFTRNFWSDLFKDQGNRIGELSYDDGSVATLDLPDSNNVSYNIQINNRQTLQGIYIVSHRAVFNYRAVPHISLNKRSRKEAFDLVVSSIREKTFGQGGGQPSNYHIKETLLSWSIYGFGSQVIESDQEQIDNFLQFQDVLRKVLPKQLGFRKFVIRNAEVVLDTASGEFMIDAVSGGVSALIDLAWQIFMFAPNRDDEFVVLIDEIENHLHATMQRTILRDLMNTFPNAQFIVSTHNPLIVGSVEDSNVYVFQYNVDNHIDSFKLDLVNKAKTASEILQEVLGVPFTMPIWVEDKLKLIIEKFSGGDITSETLKEMRQALAELGLEDLMPTAISRVLEKTKL